MNKYIVYIVSILVLACWVGVSGNDDSCPTMYSEAISSSSPVFSTESICSDVTLSASDINVYEKVVYAGKVKKKLKKIRSVRTASVFIRPAVYAEETGERIVPSFREYEPPVSENYCFLFLKEINPPPPKVC